MGVLAAGLAPDWE